MGVIAAIYRLGMLAGSPRHALMSGRAAVVAHSGHAHVPSSIVVVMLVQVMRMLLIWLLIILLTLLLLLLMLLMLLSKMMMMIMILRTKHKPATVTESV